MNSQAKNSRDAGSKIADRLRSPISSAPDSERELWERLPRESAKAYDVFLRFRGLGPQRTLRQAAAVTGRSLSLLKRWSQGHCWFARAAAYDLAERGKADAELSEQRREIYRRRIANASLLERVGMALIRTAVGQDESTGGARLSDPALLDAGVKLCKLSVHMERSEVQKWTVASWFDVDEMQVSRLSKKDREELLDGLLELVEKVRTSQGGARQSAAFSQLVKRVLDKLPEEAVEELAQSYLDRWDAEDRRKKSDEKT